MAVGPINNPVTLDNLVVGNSASLSGQTINNVQDPIAPQDAATKHYVDATVGGLTTGVSSVTAGSTKVTASPTSGAVVVDVVPANFTGIPEAGVTNLVTDLAGKVPATRLINTTAPLTGGGDLTADRTLAVNTFGAAQPGVVPSSGGGTTTFLRADGTWVAPPGSITGTGTTNVIPKWASSTTLGNSGITDAGTVINVQASTNNPLTLFNSAGTNAMGFWIGSNFVHNFTSWVLGNAFTATYNVEGDSSGNLYALHNFTTDGAVLLNNVSGTTEVAGACQLDKTLTVATNNLANGGGVQETVRIGGGSTVSTVGDGIALDFVQDAGINYFTRIIAQNTASSPSFLNPKLVFQIQNANTVGTANLGNELEVTNSGVNVDKALTVGTGITSTGAANTFDTTTISSGNLTVTSGNINVTAGSVVAGTNVDAGGSFIATGATAFLFSLKAASSGNSDLILDSAGTGTIKFNSNTGGLPNSGTGGLALYGGANGATTAWTVDAGGNQTNNGQLFVGADCNLNTSSGATTIHSTLAVTGLVDFTGQSVYLGRQVLTASSGTYTPTTGTRKVLLRMVGGGGGGGGAARIGGAGGGASGGWLETWINPAATITGGAFVAGANGTAGTTTPTAGGTGGDSTVVIQGTTYTAKGGPGGALGNSTTATLAVAGGGFVTGTSAGNISSGQAPGQVGVCLSASNLVYSGAGGTCPFGAGGAAVVTVTTLTSATGLDAQGNGAGGGGGSSNNSGGAGVAGGKGTPGIIIIDEWR